MFHRYPEKRFKSFALTAETLLAVFNAVTHQCINRVVIEGVPEDAEIVHIQTTFNPTGIEAIVYHPGYPIVPEGMPCERGNEFTKVKHINLFRKEDGTWQDQDGATWRTREPLL